MSSTATHDSNDPAGLWEHRRTLTLEAARRHTRRIRIFRWILLAIITGLVVLLFAQFSGQEATTLSEENSGEAVKMINPRYNGRTEDGLPYYLTSKEAIRLEGDKGTVELINPVLHFLREEGAGESIVIADKGIYDDVNKILNLYTSVDLATDDGNRCRTTHARIFTKTKIIEGDEPIHCDGNFGLVKGNAYEILDNYRVFVFKNGVDAELDQASE